MMYAVVEGGMRPVGRIRVSGAKNSATRLLAAALLSTDRVELSNFPTQLVDVGHKVKFCRNIGVEIDADHQEEAIAVNASKLELRGLSRAEFDVPIRTTYLLAAGQLVRFGIAKIPYPGGCPIGTGVGGGRGYDLHIMVWQSLGCHVEERADHIEVRAPRGLLGGSIDFPRSTVGGTENALLCGSIARGRTEISNAYITPEVCDLIELLRRMGADITVCGASKIVINGVNGELSGARMSVMSDRIEALTWIVYAILSGGELTIQNVPFDAMQVPLIHVEQAGIDLFCNQTSIHVMPDCLVSGDVQPFELACGTHPGVISDMQPFYVLLGLAGAGTSRIYDYRYPGRIAFISELAKLVRGEHLHAQHGAITVQGPAEFRSGEANSTDLRGSMAVLIAALCANGRSVIRDVQMALRGYNNLEHKLKSLGAQISVFDGSLEAVSA
jgi:UDP-N-acetylglucosamine 1-carboxyvinyltransferase